MLEHSSAAPQVDDALSSRVIKLISDTQEIALDSISLDAPFETMGLTSLNALSIVFEIEQEFGVTIQDEEALQITDIRGVVEKLRELLQQKNGLSAAASGN